MIHVDHITLTVAYNSVGEWHVLWKRVEGYFPQRRFRTCLYNEVVTAVPTVTPRRKITYSTEENTLSYFLWAWKEDAHDSRR